MFAHLGMCVGRLPVGKNTERKESFTHKMCSFFLLSFASVVDAMKLYAFQRELIPTKLCYPYWHGPYTSI